MKIIKSEHDEALLIQDGDIKVWVDICKDSDGEFYIEWNQYIFSRWDDGDMAIKAYQENCNNFIACSDLAIDYVLENRK